MNPDLRLFFRDQFRSARAAALADAEGFQSTIFALELLGRHLTTEANGLSKYADDLRIIAAESALCDEIPQRWPAYHTSFINLYNELRKARNDVVHQGAHARILTEHSVDLAIILEDSLMKDSNIISQFMVKNVEIAKDWQPTSYLRQQMLKSSFSYMPILYDGVWSLIPDHALARYLRQATSATQRSRRLIAIVGDAIKQGQLEILKARVASPNDKLETILPEVREQPILVVDSDHDDSLVGILTAADVL